jgi:DNA-binding MarR family transcriptional regulator
MNGAREDRRRFFDDLWDSPPISMADDIWRLMNQLTFGAGMDRMDDASAEFGLNRTQARLLILLGPHVSSSQKEVATQLHVDPSTITIVADHLESLALVERQIDPTDRRGRVLRLTEGGKQVRRQLIDRLFAVPKSVVSLPDDDQKKLRKLLRRLATPD